MRKVLITLAGAASALAVASPAAAQWYPQQGHAYGYNNFGHARALQARIDQIQHQIDRLDRRDVLRDREADRLRAQSREIERQLRYSARNGLHPAEAAQIDRRIARLEQRLWRDARDGRGFEGRGYGYYDARDRDDRRDRDERRRWDRDDD